MGLAQDSPTNCEAASLLIQGGLRNVSDWETEAVLQSVSTKESQKLQLVMTNPPTSPCFDLYSPLAKAAAHHILTSRSVFRIFAICFQVLDDHSLLSPPCLRVPLRGHRSSVRSLLFRLQISAIHSEKPAKGADDKICLVLRSHQKFRMLARQTALWRFLSILSLEWNLQRHRPRTRKSLLA